jgi:WhiB family redox-sensing transcriptional regulator
MTAVDERVCAPMLTSGRAGDEPYSSWVLRARCAGRSAVFSDEERADEALAVCGRCPVRRECRAWALANAVDGVAGGMTADERATWRREAGQPEPVVTVEDFLRPEVVSVDRTWGRGRSDAILSAVARWTEDGETARQIGVRLGVTRRTVNRLRARCRERQAS